MRDVVQGAYARLALVPLGQDLDPDRGVSGLQVLNDLLGSWASEGVATGVALPLGLSDAFPIDRSFVQGVKAMLAVQLASESGIEASLAVQKEAKRGWSSLLAAYVAAPQADEDDALTWLPSLRYRNVISE